MSALIAHLQDLTARAMFGGYGVYLDGLLVGIVIEDALYLKADEQTRAHFEKAGSAPYVYLGQQRPITMSYWSVPEEALESSEALQPWLRFAQEAALRKSANKPAPRSRKSAK
jgi:DNA transformation protein